MFLQEALLCTFFISLFADVFGMGKSLLIALTFCMGVATAFSGVSSTEVTIDSAAALLSSVARPLLLEVSNARWRYVR